MSSKTPQDKKRISYEKDRRNTYGNNDKAARRGVRRRKRFNNRSLRKNVDQELQPGSFDIEDSTDRTQDLTRTYTAKRFRKQPDTPLKYALRRKLSRRQVPVPDKRTIFGQLNLPILKYVVMSSGYSYRELNIRWQRFNKE